MRTRLLLGATLGLCLALMTGCGDSGAPKGPPPPAPKKDKDGPSSAVPPPIPPPPPVKDQKK